MYHYRVYGLDLAADRPLTEAHPSAAKSTAPEAVLVHLVGERGDLPGPKPTADTLYYESPERKAGEEPTLRVWKNDHFYSLQYLSGNRFTVDLTGHRIWSGWPKGMDFGFVVAQLLGPILGLVLQLRGVIALHASVAAIEGQALAIVGSHGAGKSTLAAGFHRQGHLILSDDIAVLRTRNDLVWVEPGYPRLRLWPAAAEALQGKDHGLRPIAPDLGRWDKRYLDVNSRDGWDETRPLRAIYILDGGCTEGQNLPAIVPATGTAAVSLLDAHSVMYALLDRQRHSRQLSCMASLLGCVAVRRVLGHHGLDTVAAACEAIGADFRTLL